ncbi:MAG: T9SS type A sorting domain-containing protein [Candidatus Marinimicrobia bacterium]|nr:T9SS type A sorting domain-containing protein [Candidatus Neomarinimicrobiota bacterium]
MKRRDFIKTGIVGTAALGFTPTALLKSQDCPLTQNDILGPYWTENHPNRTLLANADEPGTRIFISGTVKANDCETPIENAIVDVWHANDNGCYTIFMECDSGNSDDDPYNLRGQMITNENGEYAFETIWPGYYAGRPKHFHYKITTPNGLELVTQCYFEGDAQIDSQWEEDHQGLIIPLDESGSNLYGVFDIVMDEELIQVGTQNEKAHLLEKPILYPAYPNPFNSSTQIKFNVSRQGHMSIGVYDISGKWITSLMEKHISPGAHKLNWNGNDMLGKPVSAGLYLVILKFGAHTISKKISLLK